MPKATWEGVVLAQSDDCVIVEGNQYFPAAAVRDEYFRPSIHTSVCPWKGTASYYTLAVDGKENPDAAWYYPDASEKAKNVEGYVAFWRGVSVER